MTTEALQTPLPVFTGADGLPLTGGYVYFGEPNLDPRQYPLAVYLDAALSITATQPLRTTAGYLYRNGSPTGLWVDGSRSVMVLDSAGRQVYYIAEWEGVAAAAAAAAVVAAAADSAAANAAKLGAVAARTAAELARDGALLSRGVFATTAKAMSKGVASYASLVGGAGGTNGTFDIAFSGGAGSGAAGRFVVAGGALVSITITSTGDSYTSAPAMSFAASAGLAGASATSVIANNVDPGEYFTVPSSSAYEAFILYQNVAGVATDTTKRIPNVTQSPIYAGLEHHADAFGNVFMLVDENSQLFMGADAKSLQQQLQDARSATAKYGAYALGMRAESDTGGDAVDIVRAGARDLDGNYGAAAYVNKKTIQPGDVTYRWRHPLMVKTARNHILLFAQEIFAAQDRGVGDIDGARIMVCDLSFNETYKTFTQSAWREIVNYRATLGAPGGTASLPPRAAATHCSACRLRFGANKGRIVLHFSTNQASPNSSVAMLPKFTYSDDNGQTWAAVAALTVASIGAPGYRYSGNGRMIQLRYNTAHRGRILSPAYFSGTAFASIYSDDNGSTWTRGTLATTGTNEAQFAEDIDGTVYAAVRGDEIGGNTNLLLYKSTDAGVTWSAATPSTLPGNYSCQTSLVQCADEITGAPRMLRGYLAPTTTTTSREHMKVALSYDAFATVAGTPLALEPATNFCGYSAVEMWNEQDAITVYEWISTVLEIGDTTAPGLMAASFNLRSMLG